MRLSLRSKLLIATLGLVLLPLVIAGISLIQIARDERRSSALDELALVAGQVAANLEEFHTDGWQPPLKMCCRILEDPSLTMREKTRLLTSTLGRLDDVVSLQVRVEGRDDRVIVQNAFQEALREHDMDPVQVLSVPADQVDAMLADGRVGLGRLAYLAPLDRWLLTVALPVEQPIDGRPATLAARIDLGRLRARLERHPFARRGDISLIDATGHRIFRAEQNDLSEWEVVAAALPHMKSDDPPRILQAFTRPSGQTMLTAVAFPASFDWAVIVEQGEEQVYSGIDRMTLSLLIWLLVGLGVAALAAAMGARQIGRPIREFDRVVDRVGDGDLNARVEPWALNNQDEIGLLGRGINLMIQNLRKRVTATGFAGGESGDAVQHLGSGTIKPGGERRLATVFFSDVRGITAFSDTADPEMVIDILNQRLSMQADLVRRHGGEVHSPIGDELIAVFLGETMAADALRCAAEIQAAMHDIDKPDGGTLGIGIGINTGEVVMGAMGTGDRMEFTMIGETLNLGARLCAAAKRGQIILSAAAVRRLGAVSWVELEKMDPIRVKGKASPIEVFRALAVYEPEDNPKAEDEPRP